MENVMPTVEATVRRVGGSTHQVPMEVRPRRQRRDPVDQLIHVPSERTLKQCPVAR